MDDLDRIENGGLYSDESLEVLSLHLGEHSSVEMHVRDNGAEVVVTARDCELTVTLNGADRIESIQKPE